jgi:hypothetical protein
MNRKQHLLVPTIGKERIGIRIELGFTEFSQRAFDQQIVDPAAG